MKLRTLLNEIGDTTKVFPYNKNSIPSFNNNNLPDRKTVDIEFKTDKNTHYIVTLHFDKYEIDSDVFYEIIAGFNVKGQGDNYSHQTNKFEIFPVISTVIDIITQCILKNKNFIKYVSYIPAKSDDDDSDNHGMNSQRGKLYSKFLQNKFKQLAIGYEVSTNGSEVSITLLDDKIGKS